jgi:hypothetical protein
MPGVRASSQARQIREVTHAQQNRERKVHSGSRMALPRNGPLAVLPPRRTAAEDATRTFFCWGPDMTRRSLHLVACLHGLAAVAALAAACSTSPKPNPKCENVTCPPATDLCHIAGTCDSSTGTCSAQTAKICPGGQSCDPANGQCKAADACARVTCPAASDLCHVAGTCSGGVCGAQTAKTCPSGQSCNPTNGQCSADACAGVTCPAASDLCHVAGTCSGGVCGAQTAKTCPSGQSCDPANGQCSADACAGVTCPAASDLCHVAGTCSGGVCGAQTAKSCEGGMTCDVSDGQCRVAGACAGVTCPTGQSCDPGDGKCKSGSQLAPKPLGAKSLAIGESGAIDLAIDSSGATYVTGSIFPPAKDFDDISVAPSESDPTNHQGGADMLLAKYSPETHKAVWARAYGDKNTQAPSGLALTQDGTLAVLGAFEGTLPAANNETVSNPNPEGYADVFLMGVDSATGDVKWTNMFDNGISGVMVSVAANPSRNIIAVCGYASQASDMVTPAPTYGGGTRDAVIAAFDSSGAKLWAHEFGGANIEMCSAVAVDDKGDVYAAGRYNGAMDLGLGALPNPGGLTVVNWLWVAKFNGATGATMAATHFEGHNLTTHANFGNHTPQGIAVDAAGNVAVVGSFTGNMEFGATTLVTAGGTDAFIAKLDSALAPKWAVRLGGPGADIANGVQFTWAGDPVVVGSHVGTSTGAAALTAPGTVSNGFVLKLSAATGETQFAETYGDGEDQSALRVAIRGSTFSFVGKSTGLLDFGGGVTATNDTAQGFLVLGALQ